MTEIIQFKPDADIATGSSPGRVLVITTREDLTIVRETKRLMGSKSGRDENGSRRQLTPATETV
jgi:hypothetical protein